jgi:HTH-type transcriptional regulator / antitoxin HigA
MSTLKYKVITGKTQYSQYCDILEALVFSGLKDQDTEDEIDLLTVLIEKYDDEHNTFTDVDPIRLLRSLMDDHNLKAKDLCNLLMVSKGYVSDILNYKKGLSKESIRMLSERFKLNQQAFNRPYKLIAPAKKLAVPGNKAGNYEKHPFFIKKANTAKALLKRAGLPKQLAKAK